MPWVTEGRVFTPDSDTLLADTGDLGSAGSITFTYIVSCSSSSCVVIQQRNAANTESVREQYFCLPATVMQSVKCDNVPYGDNERIRIVTMGAINGEIQASLFF